MNDYPNTSANIPNTWSTQGTTSSFNNYTLNTKWSHQNAANQSGSGTPTNPSTLTTTFPSFSGGIPPLYPSISAQSSNSIQGGNNGGGGGAPSPFGSQNPSNINLENECINNELEYIIWCNGKPNMKYIGDIQCEYVIDNNDLIHSINKCTIYKLAGEYFSNKYICDYNNKIINEKWYKGTQCNNEHVLKTLLSFVIGAILSGVCG
eukprot:385337_1